jgi:lysophospholipid acyltransferase (LPLAT)-like uncharacterized protein
VANEIADVYRLESLDKYSLRERILIRLADIVFFAAITLIGRTIRWEIAGSDRLDAIKAAAKVPIFCLWHDRIFGGTFFLRDRGIVVMTSQSRDGEYIARFLKRFGFGTIRGSSTRGGVRALVEMIRYMRRGLPMAFTVDGPRGPRYVAKTGPIMLAKKTGNPVLPFSVECSSFWTINSWDRMQIPKPFTRAHFLIGEPIYVAEETNGAGIESKRLELQHALETLGENGRNIS